MEGTSTSRTGQTQSSPLGFSEAVQTPRHRRITSEQKRAFLLDSPQHSAVKRARHSNTKSERQDQEAAERLRLQKELSDVQKDISQLEAEYLRSSKVARLPEQSDDGADEDTRTLEEILRGMDDKTLASIMTDEPEETALEAVLRHLGSDDLPHIIPPARSAGIEGTGSGQQLDQEESRLIDLPRAQVETEVERALDDRIRRYQRLRQGLAEFTSVTFTNVHSAPPVRAKTNAKRLLRRVTMRGLLEEQLGEVNINVDIEEDEQSKSTPQIVGLDIEVGDALYAAIGERQISRFVDKVNLPALLLAVRTLCPLAVLRYQLFAAIASLYPDLSKEHSKEFKSRGMNLLESKSSASLPSLVMLIDPQACAKLSLVNNRGARFVIHFDILFNEWGHALPRLSIEAQIPDLLVTRSSKGFLEDLPRKFEALVGNCPSRFNTQTALIAVIDAFFDH